MNDKNKPLKEYQLSEIHAVIDQAWSYVEFTANGIVLGANDNFVQLFGYLTQNEIVNQHHQIFCKKSFVTSEAYELFWEDLRSGQLKAGEFERITKDGETVWINASYAPVKDNEGKVVKIIKIAADITPQKRAQQQAEGIQSVVDEGWCFVEFNPDGTVINGNSNFVKLFGYEVLGDICGKHHRIFCDKDYASTPEYKEFWERLGRGERQSGEFERITKEGETIWINASYAPVKDNEGTVVKIIKIAADVTPQKKAQQQAEGIQSVVDEGWCFVEFKPDGTVINGNSNFVKLFGYEVLGDICGKHHRIFCDKAYASAPEYKEFWERLGRGERQSGEFERISKNGNTIWINASYSPVRDDYGNVIKIMKIAADITWNKRMEAEIKAMRKKDLKDAQDQLIQSEKMATLGNLMAGIAHEINTPLGAIKASIEGILDNDGSYKNFYQLIKLLNDQEIQLFFEMIDESINYKMTLSSKEERQTKRKLRRELEDMGISEAYDIADMMSDLHLLEFVNKYEALVKHENNLQIFRTAIEITVQYRNGSTIKIAVDKASKIIFALKSYSHFDREDEFIEADIIQSIENVITLYSNQLKQGTELVKHYQEIPLVKCLPDQLGQVWTNLISNAIHAMNGLGKLTIEVKNKPKSVIVCIIDSGTGIPEDVAQHIFTPFFTTKSSGEGSGLGLDLVKKIIDKHGGWISFASEPGNTAFSVEIPKKEYIDKHILTRLTELQNAEKQKETELRSKIENFQ